MKLLKTSLCVLQLSTVILLEATTTSHKALIITSHESEENTSIISRQLRAQGDFNHHDEQFLKFLFGGVVVSIGIVVLSFIAVFTAINLAAIKGIRWLFYPVDCKLEYNKMATFIESGGNYDVKSLSWLKKNCPKQFALLNNPKQM